MLAQAVGSMPDAQLTPEAIGEALDKVLEALDKIWAVRSSLRKRRRVRAVAVQKPQRDVDYLDPSGAWRRRPCLGASIGSTMELQVCC